MVPAEVQAKDIRPTNGRNRRQLDPDAGDVISRRVDGHGRVHLWNGTGRVHLWNGGHRKRWTEAALTVLRTNHSTTTDEQQRTQQPQQHRPNTTPSPSSPSFLSSSFLSSSSSPSFLSSSTSSFYSSTSSSSSSSIFSSSSFLSSSLPSFSLPSSCPSILPKRLHPLSLWTATNHHQSLKLLCPPPVAPVAPVTSGQWPSGESLFIRRRSLDTGRKKPGCREGSSPFHLLLARNSLSVYLSICLCVCPSVCSCAPPTVLPPSVHSIKRRQRKT